MSEPEHGPTSAIPSIEKTNRRPIDRLDDVTTTEPRIVVTEHGPYRVVGDVAIRDAEGALLRRTGTWCLCRCGGSRNKPFCDATHGLKGFDGAESADHGSIADRRDRYVADGITVFDDRSRCAHFGQCTDRLPAVFRAAAEPFVDPHNAAPDSIADVVAGCPSGALAYARGGDGDPVEVAAEASITPIVDGPYRVRGAIQVVGADGRAYEPGNARPCVAAGSRTTSRSVTAPTGTPGSATRSRPNSPPPALAVRVGRRHRRLRAAHRPLLRRHLVRARPDPGARVPRDGAGPSPPRRRLAGRDLRRTDHLHRRVRRLRAHARQAPQPRPHRDPATAMGGPHARRRRPRRTPTDPDFRSTFVAYLEWGTRLAVINSQPDAAVMEHAPIPHWGWGQTPPFQPQPWDTPDAAEQGRRRHAQQQPATDHHESHDHPEEGSP